MAERFHINPETGQPNLCTDGADCTFGGDDFHYASKHDAAIAWKARQLERGIIAYRNVMQAKEKTAEDKAFAGLRGKAKTQSKRFSLSVVRSVIARNISRYVINFMGIFTAYAVASGKWLTDDWIGRLLPTVATVLLVVLAIWFGFKFFKGSRRAARAVRKRNIRRTARKLPTGRPL